MAALSGALEPQGFFMMLENTHDRARTVFPRAIDGWKRLAADNGLMCTYTRGYGFDVLPRLGRQVLGFSGFRTKAKQGLSRLTPEELADATYERYVNSRRHRRYTYVFRPLVAASYVAEPFSQLMLPSRWATHCAFVFKKEG